MSRLIRFVQASATQQAAASPVALAPWPTDAVSVVAATDLLAGALGESDEDTLERLGSTAAALVQRYAPAAPQPVKNEAVIRTCGWLKDQPSAAVRSTTVGPLSIDYAPSNMSALRHSGAMALLSPWKVRRAGAIG